MHRAQGDSSFQVSIVTTVYNRQEFIKDAVESVMQCMGDAHYEYIIIDDCSSDNSWELICELAEKHSSVIHAYRNAVNIGDYANRRLAVSRCTGKYVKFLDADDKFYPHTMQVFLNATIETPDCSLYLSWNVVNPPWPLPKRISTRQLVRHEFLEGDSYLGVGPSAAMFNRADYFSVGGFNTEPFIGDTDLWRRLASQFDVCLLPPSLVYWRQHEGQQIVKERRDSNGLFRRFEEDLRYLNQNQHHFTPMELRRIRRRMSLSLWKSRAKFNLRKK